MIDIATLGLEVDTTGLSKGTNELNKFQKASENAAHGAEGLKESLKSVVETLGVVEFFKEMVGASIQLERTSVLVDVALKNLGTRAGITKDEMEEYAEQLSNVSDYSHGTILESERMMLQLGVVGDTLPRATKAAANLAAVFGEDLPSAASMLGKALKDPELGLMMLNRQTRLFSQEEKAALKQMVENGDTMQAQEYILHKLESAYGGAAETIHHTFGGAIAGLKNSFEDLLENKGLDDARDSIESLSKTLKDPDVISGFNTLTSALIKLTEWTAKFIEISAKLPKNVGENMAAGNFQKNLSETPWYVPMPARIAYSAGKMAFQQAPSTELGTEGPKGFAGISDYLHDVSGRGGMSGTDLLGYGVHGGSSSSETPKLPAPDLTGNREDQAKRAANLEREYAKGDAELIAKTDHLRDYGVELEGTKRVQLDAMVAEGQFNKLGDKTIATMRAKADAADEAAKKYKQQQILTANDETARKEQEALTAQKDRISLTGESAEALDKYNYAQDQYSRYLEKTKGLTDDAKLAEWERTQGFIAQHDAIVDLQHQTEISFGTGMKEAIRDFTASAADDAQHFKDVFNDGMGEMEDAILKFAQTGKLSFHDFANAIIVDLERIAIEKMLAGIVGSFFGNAASSMGSLGGGGGSFTAGGSSNFNVGAYGAPGTYDSGGSVTGPGTGTSDSIPAMLSNGEYVVKADAVKRYGTGFFDMINSGKFMRASRFAMGGAVGGQQMMAASISPRMNIAYTIDARGADPASAANILRALEASSKMTENRIYEAIRRGYAPT